jgi:hypothetical protein
MRRLRVPVDHLHVAKLARRCFISNAIVPRPIVLGVTGFRVGVDSKLLEADFVKIAKRFGEKRAIGYGAWRDAGVCAQVLERAGVARTRG